MLTIFGKPHRNGGFCDGVSRRDFLTIGGALLGGLSLPKLLAAETASGGKASHKAIINVFLPGGPPHIDMWDLKPDAPVEIRGEYKPIKTKVPGIEICELFPQLAAIMDKLVVIRTISDSAGGHDAFQCMTGRRRNPQQAGYWPALGAWVSKLQGAADPAIPPHLSLMYKTPTQTWGDPGDGGFLGVAHAPFRLLSNKATEVKSDNMVLRGVTLEQLQDRVRLLKSFDSLDRSIAQRGVLDGIDAYNEQALGILTSSKLVDALDLGKEPARSLEKYGVDDPAFQRDGAPRMVRNFCIARRLVEAGARVVSMNFSRWDWHGPDGKNFVQSRQDFPLLDRGVAALVSDLHDRGLDQDVSVVVWGEFGRTPKLNKDASRDHWPQNSCALMAGGGMRTGQVIGQTNRLAEYPAKRPVTFQEVFATLYTNIGLDIGKVREFDPNGRPQYMVEPGVEPLRELV
jgi:hypothetical protein